MSCISPKIWVAFFYELSTALYISSLDYPCSCAVAVNPDATFY
ncbi:MAG TPA: hypothetical protein PLW61_04250 [Caldisericia bacterium]|nr:hypothetical protein [Caldisericia bacterium]